jgi:hypothetical protein
MSVGASVPVGASVSVGARAEPARRGARPRGAGAELSGGALRQRAEARAPRRERAVARSGRSPALARCLGSLAWALSLVFALAAAPPPLLAQRSPEADARARELYLRGDRYYNEGRYQQAVDSFQESYRLSGRPLLLFNLANAYERLGRYEEALDSLRRYAPHAELAEESQIRARLAELERRAEATAAGDRPPPEGAEGEPEGSEAPALTPPAPSTDGTLLAAGLAIGGLGVVLGVGGAIMGALALDARSLAQASCSSGPSGTICEEGARGPLADDALFALLADVGFGVGAAALVAGVVLVVLGVTSDGQSESAGSARVVPYAAPVPGGGELGALFVY